LLPGDIRSRSRCAAGSAAHNTVPPRCTTACGPAPILDGGHGRHLPLNLLVQRQAFTILRRAMLSCQHDALRELVAQPVVEAVAAMPGSARLPGPGVAR
jgi:hypothetical protein